MNSTFRRIPPAVAAAVMLSSAPLAAQEPRTVTLDEALALFAGNNLELRIARAAAVEAAAMARQASAYPNPTVTGTHESLSGNGRSASESYLNLRQRLEWPGTRGARQDAAERTAAAARARLAADSARLAFEVKEAYTRAVEAQLAERVLARVTRVFRDGEESAEERYREGDISLYDRRRIGVERTRYENRLAQAELESTAARRRLALLVAPEGQALEMVPVESPADPPPRVTAQEARAMGLERRQEVASARSALAAAQSDVSAARRERIPDITATGGYKRQSDGQDGLFVGLSLPVPFWNRRGGAIEAAEARVAAAGERASLVRRQVENDVRRTLENYRSLVRRADLMGTPGAGEANDLLEIARVAYAEGEMELLELLDAAEALMEARLAETRFRADYWISYYDLERAVGGFDGPRNDAEEKG